MLVFGRSICGNGKFFRVQYCQMYQVQTNIVLGGRGRIQGVVVEMLIRL